MRLIITNRCVNVRESKKDWAAASNCSSWLVGCLKESHRVSDTVLSFLSLLSTYTGYFLFGIFSFTVNGRMKNELRFLLTFMVSFGHEFSKRIPYRNADWDSFRPQFSNFCIFHRLHRKRSSLCFSLNYCVRKRTDSLVKMESFSVSVA